MAAAGAFPAAGRSFPTLRLTGFPAGTISVRSAKGRAASVRGFPDLEVPTAPRVPLPVPGPAAGRFPIGRFFDSPEP